MNSQVSQETSETKVGQYLSKLLLIFKQRMKIFVKGYELSSISSKFNPAICNLKLKMRQFAMWGGLFLDSTEMLEELKVKIVLS